MCSSHQHQFSVASRLRLTTQKMANTFMMTLKERHLKLTWIIHKILSFVLVHLKMQNIQDHQFSLQPTSAHCSAIRTEYNVKTKNPRLSSGSSPSLREAEQVNTTVTCWRPPHQPDMASSNPALMVTQWQWQTAKYIIQASRVLRDLDTL